MTESVALRSKLYTYMTLSGSGDKKCKRVNKCVMKNMLDVDFEDCKQCPLAGRNTFRKQLLLWNKLHQVHTVQANMLALSRDDDKGVVLSDDMSMLANGYKEASATNVI